MLGHHHVAQHGKTVLAAHAFERCFEEFLRNTRSEIGLAVVATECDEVELSGLQITNESLRHWVEDTPQGRGLVLSHISNARCGAPRFVVLSHISKARCGAPIFRGELNLQGAIAGPSTSFPDLIPQSLHSMNQFSVGLVMWSTTRLGTDSCTASSLSPSCSCTAVKIEGQLSGSRSDQSRPN